jgi:tetratricopeptide (TPR) repeat protein
MVERPMSRVASRLQRIAEGRWRRIWLLLAIIVYTPLTDVRVGKGNVSSDLAAMESLVERHTMFINDSPFDTIDKLQVGERIFSQKSPVFIGAATLPLWPLRWMGVHLGEDTALCLRVVTLWMVIVPMGWLLWLIFSHPWMRSRPVEFRAAMTAAFGLGSLLTPYAITLNHYVLAAACLMKAVHRLTPPLAATGERTAARAEKRPGLAVGFWVSASLACDVPAGFVVGAAAGAWWLLRAPRRVGWMAAGAAPLVLAYAACNMALLGSPLPATIYNEAMLYRPGTYWGDLKAAADAGHAGYYQASNRREIVHAAIGHKGVYWMMPLLIVATAGAIGLARRRVAGSAAALAWALFLPAMLVVTMSVTIDLSGGSYAIRHVLAAVPPLFCVLAHPGVGWGRWSRRVGWAAGAWGMLIAGIGLYNPWSHNTLSAWPPLENVARWCLAHPDRLPTEWIGPLIESTSVTPEIGWLDLGLEYRQKGKLDKAERALKAAVALRPRDPLAYYHLGIVLDMQGRPAEALHFYDTLLELDPNNVGAWNNAGLFALHADLENLARDSYNRSLQLKADNASGLWGMLAIDTLEGRNDPNSPRLRRALELYPRDARFAEIERLWRSGTAVDKNL